MATNIFANITQRGTNAAFREAMDSAPNVYQKHCKIVPSDAPDEQYVWLGAVPIPREFVSGRDFQGMRDFTMTLTNKTYELSFIIDRTTLADDRHGFAQERIGDVAEAYATFKDSLFGSLLINAETDTAFDGTAFHDGSRTIGNSGTIDNTSTANITDPNSPTTTELLAAFQVAIPLMSRYADDQGRVGFMTKAMTKLSAVIPPEMHKAFTEVINSTLIGSGNSNPWANGIMEFDVLPYLTDADNAFYLSALGANRKPFLFQEREPFEAVVLNSADDIAENDGIKVLARERFRFGYMEPRYNMRFDFT